MAGILISVISPNSKLTSSVRGQDKEPVENFVERFLVSRNERTLPLPIKHQERPPEAQERFRYLIEKPACLVESEIVISDIYWIPGVIV